MRPIHLLLVLPLACAKQAPPPGEAQGVVELHERVLSFELSGRVRELKVTRGAHVEQGQLLAVLDDALERPQRDARAAEARAADAQLDLLKAGARGEDVRAADAQVRAAQANERTVLDSVVRFRKLRAAGTIAPAQLEEAEGAAARATAERQAAEERAAALRSGARSQELRAAIARSAQAHAALEAAEARLSRLVLSAPVAGAVLDTHVETGEVVQAGTPAVTLGETQRPYVDVFVPQPMLAGIRAGTPASVRIDADPGAFRGAVEVVGRTAEFTPRYLFSEKERPNLVVRVRIALEDPAEKLHAGVPAFATFQRDVEARR